MNRLLRRALVLSGAALLLAGLLREGWLFFGQYRAIRQVEKSLESSLGCGIALAGIDVHPAGCNLRCLEFYQPGSDRSGSPWATINQIPLDLQDLQGLLLARQLPQRLTLRGVTIRLHLHSGQRSKLVRVSVRSKTGYPTAGRAGWGQQGKGSMPITFSSVWPTIRIEQGQLILQDKDRPDLVIAGIQADLHGENGQLSLSGKVDDSTWGEWSAKGSLETATGKGSVALRTRNPVHLNHDKMSKMGLLAPGFLRQVEIRGLTSAELDFAFGLIKPAFHSRAVFTPQDASLRLPAIRLTADQVQGKVVLEQRRLQLERLKGLTAGGRIEAAGRVSLDPRTPQFNLALRWSGLRIDQLPRENWSFPKLFTGLLSGTGWVRTLPGAGAQVVWGKGEAWIDQARLGGIPLEPITLRMRADQTGFHFELPVAGAARLPRWPTSAAGGLTPPGERPRLFAVTPGIGLPAAQ